jgi:hypothetical protein
MMRACAPKSFRGSIAYEPCPTASSPSTCTCCIARPRAIQRSSLGRVERAGAGSTLSEERRRELWLVTLGLTPMSWRPISCWTKLGASESTRALFTLSRFSFASLKRLPEAVQRQSAASQRIGHERVSTPQCAKKGGAPALPCDIGTTGSARRDIVVAYAELAPNRLGEPLGTYAVGYLDAARVLFAHADDGGGLVDLYFYPAAMCLRHGLELFAKQCCDYMAYELKDPGLLYVPGHSLQDAWERCGALVNDILSDEGPSVDHVGLRQHIEFFAHLTEDLHALDPNGALFRYPEFVSVTGKGATRARGTERRDTHVPFERVELGHFAQLAGNAVTAAQEVEYWLHERAAFLRGQRGDPPMRLADLVSGNVSDEERQLWQKLRSEPVSYVPPD